MKIKDGLNLPGWRVEIPDCSRLDLPGFFKERGFKVGVEIGVFTGLYSEVLCKAGLKVYSIDPWMIYPDFFGSRFPHKQERMEKNYERAKRRLAPYDCVITRKTSMEAVGDFEDGSLDFVYIDGNHSFKYVAEDVFEWSRKVKKGGIISGHDYRNDKIAAHPVHVKYVLDAYAEAYNIPKWYILGKENDTNRDKDRSWFWFNP